jgi:aryl sulfotransferase
VPIRYRSHDDDSARWDDFEFRDGDIVISTRSKHGTTWMQMICALLVFQSPDLPAPLTELSPWVDWLVLPRAEMLERLRAQRHRRFVKTHTPLDGVPLDERATYIVVARHPLDAAVSMYHHGKNLDRERIAALTGNVAPASVAARPPLLDWLRAWIDAEPRPQDALDSLPGVCWHVADAWARRRAPNVVLVHYADLSNALDGEMRRLAGRLGIGVPEAQWPALVAAAGFDRMRAQADLLAPDAAGVLKDRAGFFREGRSGAGAALLAPADRERYEARTRARVSPELWAWLHR